MIEYKIPVDNALEMLTLLELYAKDCYNNTQRHLAAVKALETREAIEEYNYKSGYPDKLIF